MNQRREGGKRGGIAKRRQVRPLGPSNSRRAVAFCSPIAKSPAHARRRFPYDMTIIGRWWPWPRPVERETNDPLITRRNSYIHNGKTLRYVP